METIVQEIANVGVTLFVTWWLFLSVNKFKGDSND